MNIKLDSINSGVTDEIIVKEENILFPKELIERSEITDLKDISFEGRIYKDISMDIILEGKLSGKMILEDSISLENVEYSFSTDIEENLENNENTIDIISILWQNIVLEVPLRYTEVDNFESYSGDGWKLINENEKSKNSFFDELKEKFKEE